MTGAQRKRKLKMRSLQEHRLLATKRKAIERVLAEVGILDLYKKLPPPLRKVLIGLAQPVPRLRISPEAQGMRQAERIEKWFRGALDTPFEPDGSFQSSLSGREIHTALESLPIFFGIMRKLDWQQVRRRCRFALGIVRQMEDVWNEYFQQTGNKIVARVYCGLTAEACEASELDGAIFWIELIPADRVTFLLKCVRARKLRVDIGGQPRPVFQCYRWGLPVAPPVPLEWPSTVFEGKHDSLSLPVFIQRHAVWRFKKRVPRSWIDYALLAQSLTNPVVERGRSGQMLVAYGTGGLRLGYFVCEVVQDMIVLKTFLFLTMRDTPEGQRIRQRLRLAQRDVDALGLERAETFINTDLRTDPELCSILADCGVGHLVGEELAIDLAKQRLGCAQEMRKYLRMPARIDMSVGNKDSSLARASQRLFS